MFAQVRTAAGIHMSTFKAPSKDGKAVADGASDSPPEDPDGSDWTPPPSFLEQMRRSDAKAGV